MFLPKSLFLLALCAPGLALAAQATPAAPTTDGQSPATPPSATLQPALDVLKTAIATQNIDRWKASAAIKSEAQSNLQSVQHDLDATLPALLATADSQPASAAKLLPVYRNVEALYDVMLRLDAAARLAAPADQMSALDQSLSAVSDRRRSLGDLVQSDTDAQEQQVTHLQAALRAIPPPAPPVVPTPVACIPPAPKKKTPVKSTHPAPTTQNSATPAH